MKLKKRLYAYLLLCCYSFDMSAQNTLNKIASTLVTLSILNTMNRFIGIYHLYKNVQEVKLAVDTELHLSYQPHIHDAKNGEYHVLPGGEIIDSRITFDEFLSMNESRIKKEEPLPSFPSPHNPHTYSEYYQTHNIPDIPYNNGFCIKDEDKKNFINEMNERMISNLHLKPQSDKNPIYKASIPVLTGIASYLFTDPASALFFEHNSFEFDGVKVLNKLDSINGNVHFFKSKNDDLLVNEVELLKTSFNQGKYLETAKRAVMLAIPCISTTRFFNTDGSLKW